METRQESKASFSGFLAEDNLMSTPENEVGRGRSLHRKPKRIGRTFRCVLGWRACIRGVGGPETTRFSRTRFLRVASLPGLQEQTHCRLPTCDACRTEAGAIIEGVAPEKRP
eukprot:6212004-Pleurochrysis_carterae.AAC.2